MIRIGILGAAKIGPDALIKPVKKRDDCIIVCVAARDRARAKAYADRHAIADTAESYEALIARPDIDLIYNALPPHRHADLSIAALEAGKAVLCEKPFAMNAAEAQRMVNASKRTGRPLIEAFHYRFHPMFESVLAHVRGGAIGRLCAIKADFSVPIPNQPGELRYDPALGGGALMDLGCYALHWARTVAGSEPHVVKAQSSLTAQGADLTTRAELVFDGNIIAQIRTSMAPDQRLKALLALKGSGGTLIARNPLSPHRGHSIAVLKDGEVERYTVPGETTYDHQLAHVVSVLKTNVPPLTGGADGVANMALIDAIYAAAGVARRV
ncbi:Gfo/Idh/MocA family protein [Hyphomonas sp.]|uniref:Gfo/Idh/MocA family protein n=1 Tax=Hyphomonas sp. TaxID=87 RepID=UPI00391AF3FA